MPLSKKPNGFAFIEALVIITVVALIAVVGFKVYENRSTDTSQANASQTSTKTTASQTPLSTGVSTVPEINSSSDLDKASQTLDQNDPTTANNADTAQLDKDSSNW